MKVHFHVITSNFTILPPPHRDHKSKSAFWGLSFCLHVRLQFILQLIMHQSLWLIKSKQRAFNPIHSFFFSFHCEQAVKHYQIPHIKQRGGRHHLHLLSRIVSRKLQVREQLAVQMAGTEDSWRSYLLNAA